MGVAPEHEVIYPRINPNDKKDNELTNGHTHFMLIGDSDLETNQSKQSKRSQQPPAPAKKQYAWGDETPFKFEFAKRIAAGRGKKGGSTACKIVTVVVGDNPECLKDIDASLRLGIPCVILDGSELSMKLDPESGAKLTLE